MAARRGTSNTNARGNSTDRRARRLWLLRTFGNGLEAPCVYCGTVLTENTITADRWPVLGVDGGTYARGNIRPACGPCNSREGGKVRRTQNDPRSAASG